MIRRRPKYNLSLLHIKKVSDYFNKRLEELNRTPNLVPLIRSDISEAWKQFEKNIHQVAGAILKEKREVTAEEYEARKRYTRELGELKRPRVIDARAQYNELSDRPRIDKDLQALVGIRRRQYQTEVRKRAHNELVQRLTKIEKTSHVSVRLNQTFKLIRYYRRRQNQTKTTVPFTVLHEELSTLDRGNVPMLPDDGRPLPALPKGDSMYIDMYDQLKCGISPGPDQIHNEFVKYSLEVRKKMTSFLRRAYTQNEAPDSWHETTMFLLPKVSKPQSFNDYRPITECSVGYKLEATVLLRMLQENIDIEIPEYQCGFLKNRSTDDVLFTLQRILETRWNHGLASYIMTVDIKKAFSRVSIHKLPEVLTRYGVPAQLINRIIHICLTERTRINYLGQQTNEYKKTLGIKQGCPISPYLFVLIFHAVLSEFQRELEKLTPSIKLFMGEPENELKLPMLLGYADDLTLLSTNLKDMDQMIPLLVQCLAPFGLEINAMKSELLIKTPNAQLYRDIGDVYKIGHLEIPVKHAVTILGTRINSDMNRRSMIIDRLRKAWTIYHQLLRILKSLKLKFPLLVRMYSAIVVPVMLYGLRSVSFTKQQQIMLMHREVSMLRGLAQIAYPKPKDEKIERVLKNRTINRVLTVGRLCYASHLYRKPNHSMLNRALGYRVQTKRKLGRPCYTYQSSLEKEFRMMTRIPVSSWVAAFASADSTKKFCQGLYAGQDLCSDPMSSNVMLY